MSEQEPKPRERSVAHLWCDKRFLRMFRKNFDKKEYRKLRDVYLALCEIDSDFTEERNETSNRTLHSIVKTCITYTGMDHERVKKVMQGLREAKIIDYGKKRNDKGQVIGSYLTMYEWMGKEFYEKNYMSLKLHIAETTRIKNDKSGEEKNSSKEEGLKIISSSKEEEASRFARGSKSSQENKWRKEANISTQTNNTHLDKPNIQRLSDNNNGAVVLEKKSVTRGKRISCSNDTDSFEIINKWNDLGLMYVDPQHNKSIASRLDQLMSGRFFLDNPLSNGFANKYSSRAFTKDEILSAIENRARAACDIEYAPSDIKAKEKIRKVPFFVWLYEKNKGQSLFLKDFTKMAQLARAKSKLPPDEFPDYTEAIKEKYIQEVCGGIVLRRQWPLKDQENFINSATYLVECFNSISSRIGSYFSGGIDKHVDYLFKAIRFHMKESDNDKYFPTSWLCSEQTFMKFLPAYLKAQGILQPQYYDPTGMLNRQMRGFHRTEEE